MKCPLSKAENVMTSRYVVKWKWVQHDGKWSRIIRMRLVLRGFMDLEAYSLDTFSGTARRQSQRIVASEAACNKEWVLASLDIDKAFLKGFTYKELAEARNHVWSASRCPQAARPYFARLAASTTTMRANTAYSV